MRAMLLPTSFCVCLFSLERQSAHNFSQHIDLRKCVQAMHVCSGIVAHASRTCFVNLYSSSLRLPNVKAHVHCDWKYINRMYILRGNAPRNGEHRRQQWENRKKCTYAMVSMILATTGLASLSKCESRHFYCEIRRYVRSLTILFGKPFVHTTEFLRTHTKITGKKTKIQFRNAAKCSPFSLVCLEYDTSV